jgi:microsomal epoxide hydrolase
LAEFLKEETARPQTLAFGLFDSPAGLAAWIVEKFRAWTDNDGTPETAVERDRVLANISLYWFTGCIGASFHPYYARTHGPWPIEGTVNVPVGYCQFPKEIIRPPRSVAERVYTDFAAGLSCNAEDTSPPWSRRMKSANSFGRCGFRSRNSGVSQ